ncbi:hypothetical protein [Mesorhizobium sp. M0011]|uniref:hypothetical protein n=1 Tax=Mesorhizobium sp. M0011 TaxID=2956839 RepID=UPI00333BE262
MEETVGSGEYTDEQTEILARAGVSRPQELTDVMQRLNFANACKPVEQKNPVDEFRLRLSSNRLEAADMQPVERLRLQYLLDDVSLSRFERAIRSQVKTHSDVEYVCAMRAVLPFLEVESAVIVNRIIPHFDR